MHSVFKLHFTHRPNSFGSGVEIVCVCVCTYEWLHSCKLLLSFPTVSIIWHFLLHQRPKTSNEWDVWQVSFSSSHMSSPHRLFSILPLLLSQNFSFISLHFFWLSHSYSTVTLFVSLPTTASSHFPSADHSDSCTFMNENKHRHNLC